MLAWLARLKLRGMVWLIAARSAASFCGVTGQRRAAAVVAKMKMLESHEDMRAAWLGVGLGLGVGFGFGFGFGLANPNPTQAACCTLPLAMCWWPSV